MLHFKICWWKSRQRLSCRWEIARCITDVHIMEVSCCRSVRISCGNWFFASLKIDMWRYDRITSFFLCDSQMFIRLIDLTFSDVRVGSSGNFRYGGKIHLPLSHQLTILSFTHKIFAAKISCHFFSLPSFACAKKNHFHHAWFLDIHFEVQFHSYLVNVIERSVGNEGNIKKRKLFILFRFFLNFGSNWRFYLCVFFFGELENPMPLHLLAF